ncbi:MAG: alkaline phosphatase [Flavobacteriaceae bacterium]|nr:alkaline phosphatase [Flavobacteriaceae bacterium]
MLHLTSCTSQNKSLAQQPISEEKTAQPKNIILLIADGTGLSQISALQFYSEAPVNYDRFPVVGLIKTSSSSELVTDSAAGATAFASGIKTFNGAVGVAQDSTAVITIAEEVSKIGWDTGLIATSSITHATPACFYAHVPDRDLELDIALQLVNSDIDFFAGGGLEFFRGRWDGLDLVDALGFNGFKMNTSKLESSEETKQGFLLAQDGMPKMLEGRGDFLPKATQMALDQLSKNKKGFFLMVEGSQVDWGGHDNDADYLITEIIDFDKALGVAMDFAEKDGETLVIVTADHETGGFTLAASESGYETITPTFSTDSHSATMVPVFSYGPGSETFGGIYENTEIYHKMKKLIFPK